MVPTVIPFAMVDFRDDHRVFGLKPGDRRYHLLTIGRTGTGKSTLLRHLIKGDLEAGHGTAVVDPHGDLTETARRLVPRWRRDVIIFDPANSQNTLTFNLLHVPRPEQRHLVVSELISVFQHIWQRSWGSRLEHLLRIILLTLTEQPGHTLLDALRMLNDSKFRAAIVERIEDPLLKAFWIGEYPQYTNSYRSEAIAPIQNKLSEFVINPMLRKVFDTSEGDIRPREIMDQGQVFLANLSVGKLGRDVAMLLGASLIGKFAMAALSRSDQEPDDRRDFYLYIDEASMFVTANIDTILSENRKYRLSLILAMQFLDQLEPRLLGSVLGNVGNLVVFRVGAKDAIILAREFAPVFSAEDLMNLPYYHAYLRMMIDGRPARPFSARILEPEVLFEQS